MALDFPANPVDGQVYGSYVFNASAGGTGAWQAREDTATVAIMSAVAPTSASNGDLWVNTNDGTSFVYYEDGNSSQWVEILAAGFPLYTSPVFDGTVTADRFVSTEPTGTSPFTVTSTTLVTNLNADLLDGNHSSAFALLSSSPTFTGNITAPRLISTQANGTAPLGVTSTTVVTNLNADLLDGNHSTAFAASSHTHDDRYYTEAEVNSLLSALVPAGTISQYVGATAPAGYILAQGQELAIATYGALYAVIGTTYGALTNGAGATGTTHFRVPDLRGRIPMGSGTGAGDGASGTNTVPSGTALTARTLGAWGGSQTHTLTTDQIPLHAHQFGADDYIVDSGQYTLIGRWAYDATSTTSGNGVHALTKNMYNGNGNTTSTSGGQAHNNIQPYIVVNYIIKT